MSLSTTWLMGKLRLNKWPTRTLYAQIEPEVYVNEINSKLKAVIPVKQVKREAVEWKWQTLFETRQYSG